MKKISMFKKKIGCSFSIYFHNSLIFINYLKTYNSINRENLKNFFSISFHFVNSNIIIVVAAIIIIQAKNVNIYFECCIATII